MSLFPISVRNEMPSAVAGAFQNPALARDAVHLERAAIVQPVDLIGLQQQPQAHAHEQRRQRIRVRFHAVNVFRPTLNFKQ